MLIDSLIVTLGLDATQFNESQKKALEQFKKTKTGFVEGSKDIEYSAGKSAEAIGGIRTATLGMAAALTGSAGLVQFATNAIHAGAAAGRMSRNLGVSVETITKFQGLAEVFGGSAEGMAQSFITITDALQGWKVGQVSPLIGQFRALSAAGGVMIDVNEGAAETIKKIGENLRILHDLDPASGGYWQRQLGIDPGFYDAMIQKNETFAAQLAKITGLTNEEAEAAGKLERRWNSLVNTATKGGQAMVIDLIDSKSKFSPFTNGSDAKDLKMIAGWVDSLFGTSLASKTAASSSTASGAFKSQAEKEAFIRSEAEAPGKKRVDPNIAMIVARGEGFNQFLGDNGTSGSAFQLHVTPGGRGRAVGDEFRRATGLDPLDPANERAAIRFALDDVRAHGWGAYHGAARSGISAWAGIGGSNTTTTTTVSVNGPITIQAGPNADGAQIASKFLEGVRRQSYAAQSNNGQN
jgi:hypothetical protein